MDINAKLAIGNTEGVGVLKCNYTLRRDIDIKGRPSSGVYGGIINLTIVSTEDTSLIELMVNAYKTIEGTVTFQNTENKILKVLAWEKGYIISFKEELDITNANHMVIDFTISAEKIKIGNAIHDNGWPR